MIVLSSALFSPLNGVIIDATAKYFKSKVADEKTRNLRAVLASMIVSNIFAVTLSVLALIPSIYGSFVFFMISRVFINGSNTAFLSIHFPSYHFGKLYGLNNLTNGLMNLLQYLLFYISQNFDPTFYYINVGFLVLMFVVMLHPITIYMKIKKMERAEK